MELPLFVFEMANNHMGSLQHGLRIVREYRKVVESFHSFRFAFKLQYRDLDTFIHHDFKKRLDIKYVKRFMETSLREEELIQLVNEIKECGFIVVCTPFDEPSVDKIEKHGVDIVKVASCSFSDWPLLERIVLANKAIIASAAAAPLEEIDNVVSFFEHRSKDLTLMHCVAEYPTQDADLSLNQIDLLRTRYPKIKIGYSTHEKPDNIDAIKIAVAKGASVFEKHVGVPTKDWPLNDYSATSKQVEAWLRSAEDAFSVCGPTAQRRVPTSAELGSLASLRRGVFAKKAIRAGDFISNNDIFLAFPPQEGQVCANDWSKYTRFVATRDIRANAPLTVENTEHKHTRQKVYEVVQSVKALLERGNVVIPGAADLEISHHYGLEKFDEYGLVMITVVNREYCKKLLVMLAGQTHPEQYHEKKEETFHILYGDMKIFLDGREKVLGRGDVITVGRGVRHKMYSAGGTVFEEISTTHCKEDSYYTDTNICANPMRKTLITYWLS
ncbi:MAG TPA: N-acetylneuraminate synthase family protein [Syntrophobacteria bacterium]|nr:N-acetylneuraminate synthase family protein [Syntrophobacteria bacterium]